MRKYILEVNQWKVYEVDAKSLDEARKELHTNFEMKGLMIMLF